MRNAAYIRVLTEQDASALWEFRRKALECDPQAFGETVEEHCRTPVSVIAERLQGGGDESFMVGAFDASGLIGMAGFYREPRTKRRHKGWIWGVFVAPGRRGHGVGRALLSLLLERARGLPGLRTIRLSVSATQPAARDLYLSLGFRPFGTEPQSLKTAEGYMDEEHMVLEITRGSRPTL